MDSAKLNDWMQVIGIFAVVASLIFVGLQMKQSQEIAIAAQYQERAIAANDVVLGMMENPQGVLNLESGQLGTVELDEEFTAYVANWSPEQVESRFWAFSALMILYDNNHFQFEAGFLDEDSLTGNRNRMRSALSSPVNRTFYRIQNQGYRDKFRSVVDEVISEIESTSP
jgi:hypothetical protein